MTIQYRTEHYWRVGYLSRRLLVEMTIQCCIELPLLSSCHFERSKSGKAGSTVSQVFSHSSCHYSFVISIEACHFDRSVSFRAKRVISSEARNLKRPSKISRSLAFPRNDKSRWVRKEKALLIAVVLVDLCFGFLTVVHGADHTFNEGNFFLG